MSRFKDDGHWALLVSSMPLYNSIFDRNRIPELVMCNNLKQCAKTEGPLGGNAAEYHKYEIYAALKKAEECFDAGFCKKTVPWGVYSWPEKIKANLLDGYHNGKIPIREDRPEQDYDIPCFLRNRHWCPAVDSDGDIRQDIAVTGCAAEKGMGYTKPTGYVERFFVQAPNASPGNRAPDEFTRGEMAEAPARDETTEVSTESEATEDYSHYKISESDSDDEGGAKTGLSQ
ncbi:hypothetical protein F4778DRAFT_780409 [Xylariomycetidae sp. FL2044]|nr:hypothetical protein F4778DRAFT_780409 [Xylariomycetidae sp. FL2044]